jgi:hypothetical protein
VGASTDSACSAQQSRGRHRQQAARMAWAVLSSGKEYRHQPLLQPTAAWWPWKRRCAWKAQNAFHFPTTTTTKIAKSSTKVC